uniref:Uncharacterized protein n=1 Tax=Solanum lycopersicum TaxID=4081 RepID=A0A3Q7JV88_SOLLC
MSVMIMTSLGDIIVDLFTGHHSMPFNMQKLSEVMQDKHSKRGTVSTASVDTGTGEKNLYASQFYITLRDDLDSLDGVAYYFWRDCRRLAGLIPDASPKRKPKDEIDDDLLLEDDWMPKDEELGVGEEKESHSQ